MEKEGCGEGAGVAVVTTFVGTVVITGVGAGLTHPAIRHTARTSVKMIAMLYFI